MLLIINLLAMFGAVIYIANTELNIWSHMSIAMVLNTMWGYLNIREEYPKVTLRHQLEIIFFCYLHASLVFFLLGVIQEHRNSLDWLYMFDSTPTIWNTVAQIILLSLIGDLVWNWQRRPKIFRKYVRQRRYSSLQDFFFKDWFK